MYCREITYGSPTYAEAVALRDLVLRLPLDLEFTESQIGNEYGVYHIGAFTSDGTLIGILIGQPIEGNKDVIKIRQVAVEPSLHSRGVGTQLMQYAESFFQQAGYSSCTLNSRVVSSNFYKRCNYKVEGEEFLEVGIPHLKMTKKLV
jgi:predicted GNAT family N-acyltransferase